MLRLCLHLLIREHSPPNLQAELRVPPCHKLFLSLRSNHFSFSFLSAKLAQLQTLKSI